ncbi:MAG TPA: LysE family transporter [Chryseolinea sp.]|nr:LysE family transporter [Chryseolinea sp.]
MFLLSNFLVAFSFSFIGTIPPGSLNIIILQLGFQKKIKTAWRFALAACMVEYPYAWLAVKFEALITSSPLIVKNAELIAAIVMTCLGAFNLISANKPSKFSEKFNESGFRRGIVLSILNPLILPFWVGTTAYLKGMKWIDLSTNARLHVYLIGISLGTLALCVVFIYLAKKIVSEFHHQATFQKIPGIVLLALGLYAFIRYLF